MITPLQIEVPANTRFRIELINRGSTPVEFESVQLRKERVIGPGNETVMVIRRLDTGTYDFFDDVAVVLTYCLIQLGGRYLSWRLFFAMTEMPLLVVAALLMTGIDRLIGLGVIPLLTPLWDSSAVLEGSGPFGSFVSSLTGYRPA